MPSTERYITTDTLTGVIVATSKHHPMLQPLVRRGKRYRLPFSRTERDLVLSVGLVAGLVLAMAI